MDRWYPALRKDGIRAYGSETLNVDGIGDLGRGISPHWLDDNTLAYKDFDDFIYAIDIHSREIKTLVGHKVNMHAAGGGKFAVTGGEVIYVSVGRNGDLAEVLERGGDKNRGEVHLNGQLIVSGQVVNMAHVEEGYVVYSRFEPREVWGVKPGHSPERLLADALQGVPVITPQGPFVVAQTGTQLLVFPWGSAEGYIIDTGDNMNFNHDALWIDGRIVVVWNDHKGLPGIEFIDINQPRVPLTGTQPKPDEPKPQDPKPEEPKPMTMMLPADVHATFVACVAKFPHTGSDDDRRAAMRKAVETIRARHGLKWIWKTEHATGYTSAAKDALAFVPSGPIVEGEKAEMFIWDMIVGGTREPKEAHDSEPLRRAFVLAPAPYDWLADTKQEEPKPEDPKPVPVCDCAKVKAEVTAAMVDMAARLMQAMDDKIKALPKPEAPRLKAVVEVDPSSSSLWGKHSHGVRVKLVPEE